MTGNDEVSISILKTVAQARLGAALGELPPNLELRSALAKTSAESLFFG
jgi:hypothetical protein